jgi:hypothetical protein
MTSALATIGALLLAAMFAAAGLAKLADRTGTRDAVSSYGAATASGSSTRLPRAGRRSRAIRVLPPRAIASLLSTADQMVVLPIPGSPTRSSQQARRAASSRKPERLRQTPALDQTRRRSCVDHLSAC